MEANHTAAHFSSANCDTCGATPTIVMYHNGTPCLAQCKVCMPSVHTTNLAVVQHHFDGPLEGLLSWEDDITDSEYSER